MDLSSATRSPSTSAASASTSPADSAPTGITSGSDGNLWFTENAFPGRIGRMALGPVASLSLVQKVSRHEVTDGELQVTVLPNAQATTYHVEYGTDRAMGRRPPSRPPSASP